MDRIGFIEAVEATVGNRDMSAICAELTDVTALMVGLNPVGCGAEFAPLVGTIGTIAGGFEAAGGGFIMTGGGFIIGGIGFIIGGIGFIIGGIGFMMTGIGFIMGPIPDIPADMESRALPSSASTEIDAVRRLLRAIIIPWSRF